MSIEETALCTALCDISAYPHAAAAIEVVETHISRIYLAGDYAYKVRKPVKFDYVDFSTLDLRLHDCEREIQLNRRYAPDLYLDVVPIVLTAPNTVQVEGCGKPIEYAVKMRRFPPGSLFREMISDNRLLPEHVDLLATGLADSHSLQPYASEYSGFGTAARIAAVTISTLSALGILLGKDGAGFIPIAMKIRAQCDALRRSFGTRLSHGHVRECHGDLHLGNIVFLNGKPVPFDCLEFDPALRWIDTMNDAAFIFMDLLHHEQPQLAWRFLNGYLEAGGDYPGLMVLRFYASLRALIRARVLLESRSQATAEESTSGSGVTESQRLIALADRILSPAQSDIYLMHGLSGSGKSTVAAAMAERQEMVRIRSDAERKRLRQAGTGVGAAYGANETAKTYIRLLAISRLGCRAGFSMIADATFLSRQWRGRFIAQAKRLGVSCHIVHCEAPLATLRGRLFQRAGTAIDPSEATYRVLENQLQVQDALSPEEQKIVVAGFPAANGEAN